MNAPSTPTVHLTSDAVEAVRALRLAQARPEAAFRVDVRIGGCQGFKLYFELDQEFDDDVVVIPEPDVRVVIQRDGLPLIAGAVVDWEDSHRGRGFRLASPQARSACGCGQAFYAEVVESGGGEYDVIAADAPTPSEAATPAVAAARMLTVRRATP